MIGSLLEERFAAIAGSFESSEIDVICFQEVFTYWHLGLLARRMPSFREVIYRRSPVGPAGGLVTFSRLQVSAWLYRSFSLPPRVPDVSYLAWIRAGLKGALVTRLTGHGLCIVKDDVLLRSTPSTLARPGPRTASISS